MTRANNSCAGGAPKLARGRYLSLFLVQLGCLFRAESAHAQDPSTQQDACVLSYESAQENRIKGALQAALPELASCAEPACPAFIRLDCIAWSTAVAAEIPSVSFSITSDGRTLDEVAISLDGVPVAEKVPSQPLSLDPGTHAFAFEAPGMKPERLSVLVERAQKSRKVAVELRPLARAVVPSPATSSVVRPVTSQFERASPVFDARSLAFGAIGAGGVAGFALLGLHARSEEHQLRDDCAPHCAAGDVSSVRSQYVMADVSLGIGLASFGLSTYLFLSSRSPKRATSARLPLEVAVGRGATSATFSGAF